MADLLDNDASPDATSTSARGPESATPPPAFPPPVPSAEEDGRRLKILAVLVALALIAAVAMGLLWLSSRSATSDADTARDQALADLDASNLRQTELSDELANARADLAAAVETNDALAAERNEIAESRDTETAAAIDLQMRVTELTDDNDELVDELEAVREELETAQAEIDEATENAADTGTESSTDDSTAASSDDAATADTEATATDAADDDTQAGASGDGDIFDISDNPDFARYIGESLSSRTGSSRLGQTQSECFGTAVIAEVGLGGLGRGLTLSASAADNNAVIGAMQGGAATCNIDPGLIF